MIRVQENHLCQRRTNESLHAQNAILPLTYLTAEPLLVQDAPHLFNVTWQNVPNVGMSFHCQRNVGILIPIFCKNFKQTIVQLNQFLDLTIFLCTSNLQYSPLTAIYLVSIFSTDCNFLQVFLS